MTERAAKGTVLGIEIAAVPGTFTDLAQVRNLDGPGLALDPLDVSAHDDGAKFYRDFIGGWHDPGELTLEVLFDPAEPTQAAGLDGLLLIYDDAEVHNFRIVWPPSTGADTWNFAALVSGYEPGAPFDDALTATITLKLAGAPTY